MLTASYQSPVGTLILTADEREHTLLGLWTTESAQSPLLTSNTDELPVLREAVAWLDAYFDGSEPSISTLRLAPAGTDFQHCVWDLLCEIPYGKTLTYGALAKRVAAKLNKSRMSAQAVGGALGRNPIGIIIPCHRVIGADGSLTGYAGGLSMKQWLLHHEGVHIPHPNR